jgi:hypothetical protein
MRIERPTRRLSGRRRTAGANIETTLQLGGAVAQLGARLDGIEEVVGSNPIGSTKNSKPSLPVE